MPRTADSDGLRLAETQAPSLVWTRNTTLSAALGPEPLAFPSQALLKALISSHALISRTGRLISVHLDPKMDPFRSIWINFCGSKNGFRPIFRSTYWTHATHDHATGPNRQIFIYLHCVQNVGRYCVQKPTLCTNGFVVVLDALIAVHPRPRRHRSQPESPRRLPDSQRPAGATSRRTGPADPPGRAPRPVAFPSRLSESLFLDSASSLSTTSRRQPPPTGPGPTRIFRPGGRGEGG
jgi:hypothetical protein